VGADSLAYRVPYEVSGAVPWEGLLCELGALAGATVLRYRLRRGQSGEEWAFRWPPPPS
jgi:hypothetical protein